MIEWWWNSDVLHRPNVEFSPGSVHRNTDFPQTRSHSLLGPMCLMELRWWACLSHSLRSHKTPLSRPSLPCFFREPGTLNLTFWSHNLFVNLSLELPSIIRSPWYTEVWCSQTSAPSKGDLWPFTHARDTWLTKTQTDAYPRDRCP